MEPISITRLANEVQTEADAYRFMEKLRWNGVPVCPHCGGTERVSFLNPENGVSRKTRTGSASQRRLWFCGPCRRQFSVLVGTVFHRTKISVRTWLFVIFEMCASKNGVSAREIERKYDLTAKTAWFMLHRIREAMTDNGLDMFVGTVVADETWIGGKPSNRHGHKRGRGGQGVTDKTPVLSLVDKRSGRVRSRIVPDVSGGTLRKVRVIDGTTSTPLTRDSAEHVRVILGTRYTAYGSVEGLLEEINLHGKPGFAVYDRLTGRRIACEFGDRIPLERVTGPLMRRARVLVYGNISYRADDEIRSVAVDELEELRPDSELATADDVRGLLG